MVGAIAVIVFLYILLCTVFLGEHFSQVAVDKGYPEKKTVIFVFCILLPIAGWLLACALPDRGQKETSTKTDVYKYDSGKVELPDL